MVHADSMYKSLLYDDRIIRICVIIIDSFYSFSSHLSSFSSTSEAYPDLRRRNKWYGLPNGLSSIGVKETFNKNPSPTDTLSYVKESKKSTLSYNFLRY